MPTSSSSLPTFPPATQALLGALLWMKINKTGSTALRKLMALNTDLWHLWWHGKKAQLQLILSKEQLQQWQVFQQHCPLNLEAEAHQYNALGVEWLPFESPQFPPALREIYDPPAGLFVQGSLAGLLDAGQVGLAIVGTRKLTPYGEQMTQHLVKGLDKHPICVVSGLALGIDGVAHQAALEAGLPTIAFLGCGLDTCYPAKHAGLAEAILQANGALISEYPLGVQPLAKLFPRRNRLVVGVSVGVLIVEAPLLSGSMITARLGIQENRTVMAVPNEATSVNAAGPLQLLKEGAGMVWEPLHILQELGLAEVKTSDEETPTQLQLTPQVALPIKQVPEKTVRPNRETLLTSVQKSPENPEENQVWQAVLANQEANGITIDSLLKKLDTLSQTELAGHLTLLELEGWVTALAGSRFSANQL